MSNYHFLGMVEVGKKYSRMKYHGFISGEWAPKKRYDGMSKDERDRLAEIGNNDLKYTKINLSVNNPIKKIYQYQGVAGAISAASGINYPFSTVLTMVHDAIASNNKTTIDNVTILLANANSLSCPLG